MRSTLPLLAAALACGSPVQPDRPPRERDGADARCRLARGRPAPAVWQDGGGRAEVTVSGRPCARTFSLATTAQLVEASPDSPRRFAERADRPAVRSGNDLFDALYALAQVEAGEASVGVIRDGSFDRGAPLACPAGGCYETGKLWTYVWTRDTAYSMDLGLAALDPVRARNSLEFKLSERRGGGDLQIVQDTGSGGSWPISTDRVAWALGAERLLELLGGREREAFAARALDAIGNSVEQDRAVAFDPAAGLYRGETSFLDWREQNYPAWTARDTVEIGASHALSTNVLHLRALEIAAALAEEQGGGDRAARWRGWARDLRARIGARFRAGEQLASYTLDGTPVARQDLLGISLAILAGVVEGGEGRRLLAAYPRLPYGPPVVFPFDREVAIYHNRAVWPFVTAYALRAARRVGEAEVAAAGALSLVRGAALHLSHMENFEATTGRARLEDGPRSGPVVNSPRQLWSVAGYLSMVHELVFGLETGPDGIRFRPFLSRALRSELFRGAETLVLDRFPYRGARLTVVVSLPPASRGGGAYAVGRVRLNGRAAPDRLWRRQELADDNLVEIELVDGAGPVDAPAARAREPGDVDALFAPLPASLRAVELAPGDRIRLHIDAPVALPVAVRRDGEELATVAAGTRAWIDPDARASRAGVCYTVETVDPRTGHRSHRSRRRCWDGPRGERRRTIPFSRGAAALRVAEPGVFEVRVQYRNPGPFNTGVTCAVKGVEIAGVASGILLLPHTGDGTGEVRASSAVT
ncbi:MAG TPA: hypothetical protein VFU21_23100, partial [Kofleriaceae bacterium]|nr:hypothetical protein [Kofleriaceae bacterium]